MFELSTGSLSSDVQNHPKNHQHVNGVPMSGLELRSHLHTYSHPPNIAGRGLVASDALSGVDPLLIFTATCVKLQLLSVHAIDSIREVQDNQ